MTPAEARELVARALESGKYKQGHGGLCIEGEYCCLGVAMEVFMEHNPGIIEKIEMHDAGFTVYQNGEDSNSAVLLCVVKEWLGFRTNKGRFNNDSLILINDNGTPFTEIAKLFRNPPEGLLG